MRTYRYANLLAVFVILLAGFASVADQTKISFAIPATETSQQPIITSPNASPILAKIQTLEQGTIPAITTNPKITTHSNTTVPPTTATCSNYYGYITAGGRTICLASTNTTAGSLSYNHAYIYSGELSANQFIFGHNSSSIFAHLKNLPSDTIFSVTLSGQTTSYRVAFQETVCDYTNPNYPCSNYPEPVLNMNHAGMPYLRGADLAIMTCAGTPIGNGDATHRLIVYANKT
jgi:hypothetical protein